MNGGAAVGVGDEVGTDVVAVDEVAVLEPAVAGGPVGVAVGLAVMAAGGSGAGVEQPARTAARHAHTVTASAARGTRASGEAVMPAIITNQRGPGRSLLPDSEKEGSRAPFHSQRIAHWGACGKAPVVAQNRRPRPTPRSET